MYDVLENFNMKAIVRNLFVSSKPMWYVYNVHSFDFSNLWKFFRLPPQKWPLLYIIPFFVHNMSLWWMMKLILVVRPFTKLIYIFMAPFTTFCTKKALELFEFRLCHTILWIVLFFLSRNQLLEIISENQKIID